MSLAIAGFKSGQMGCCEQSPHLYSKMLRLRLTIYKDSILKFILDNWALMSVALASGALLLWPVLKSAGGSLTAEGAVQLINREKAVVIDVCEAAEFSAAHVGGAKNIPLSQLEDKLPGAVKNKALPVILVCQSGARSGRAVAIAKKLGYEQAQSLSGGLGAWKAANLPIEKS